MEIGVHGRLLAYGTMYKEEEEGVSLTSWQIQSKAIFSRGVGGWRIYQVIFGLLTFTILIRMNYKFPFVKCEITSYNRSGTFLSFQKFPVCAFPVLSPWLGP